MAPLALRDDEIRDDDEIDPDLGLRWQSLQRVYLGDKELLATLELPEMFAADMDYLKLHPALLDRATASDGAGDASDTPRRF